MRRGRVLCCRAASSGPDGYPCTPRAVPPAAARRWCGSRPCLRKSWSWPSSRRALPCFLVACLHLTELLDRHTPHRHAAKCLTHGAPHRSLPSPPFADRCCVLWSTETARFRHCFCLLAFLVHPSLPPLPGLRQVLSALEHRNDSAAAIPGRELSKLVYGRDSVFAREPTPEQVRAAPRVCIDERRSMFPIPP